MRIFGDLAKKLKKDMGQYYKAINIDKLEYGRNSGGVKLMEHSWLQNPFVRSIVSLLGPGGSWNGNSIVWAGDYMDPGIFIPKGRFKIRDREHYNELKERNLTRDKIELYSFVNVYGVDISGTPVSDGPDLNYILNLDKEEFVDLRNCPSADDGEAWVIHPLPLLTCSGNGRGGGDFRGDNDYVGSWAGDRIASSPEKPENFTEIFPDFKE